MKEFYNREPKVCSFMNPDITRFVLVPNVYSDDVIGIVFLIGLKLENLLL